MGGGGGCAGAYGTLPAKTWRRQLFVQTSGKQKHMEVKDDDSQLHARASRASGHCVYFFTFAPPLSAPSSSLSFPLPHIPTSPLPHYPPLSSLAVLIKMRLKPSSDRPGNTPFPHYPPLPLSARPLTPTMQSRTRAAVLPRGTGAFRQGSRGTVTPLPSPVLLPLAVVRHVLTLALGGWSRVIRGWARQSKTRP